MRVWIAGHIILNIQATCYSIPPLRSVFEAHVFCGEGAGINAIYNAILVA